MAIENDHRADIVVTNSGGDARILLVETRLVAQPPAKVLERVKAAMLAGHYPLGMLVMPERFWVLRDRYTSMQNSSVEELGPYSLPSKFREFASLLDADRKSRDRAFAFESAVQRWIDDLASGNVESSVTPDGAETLEQFVVPEIRFGDVRAAGPRYELSGR